jgi:hypothetical protein
MREPKHFFHVTFPVNNFLARFFENAIFGPFSALELEQIFEKRQMAGKEKDGRHLLASDDIASQRCHADNSNSSVIKC